MKVVGLMTGTSADGIDVALCEIAGAPPRLAVQLLHALTVPFDPGTRTRILQACQPAFSRVDQLCVLNFDLGEQLAQAALTCISEAGLQPSEVDLIGSHGQTLWHQVEQDGQVSATLQIGEATVIAERSGITTISNFRTRDVAASGQGAPITAYVDWLLLRHEDHWRAVQNLGGMGHVTFLPPVSAGDSTPLAFDTGPGNALIDAAVYILTQGAQTYDVSGEMASQGQVDEDWLADLMTHPYFLRQPPKTTGRELFGSAYAAELVAQGRARGMDQYSIMATLTALTASSIGDAYARYAPQQPAEVIIGGGGHHNIVLMNMLREKLEPAIVSDHTAYGFTNDHKEALAYAVLAHETWHNRPGTLPVFTGAQHEAVLGQITPAANTAALLRQTWAGS